MTTIEKAERKIEIISWSLAILLMIIIAVSIMRLSDMEIPHISKFIDDLIIIIK